GKYQMRFLLANTFCKIVKQFSFIDRIRIYSLHPCLNKHLSIQSNRDWLSMSIFSDYSSSSEMHNNLTIDCYLALFLLPKAVELLISFQLFSRASRGLSDVAKIT
ncbi:MAG: hypothetical protein ACLTGU_05890, partial [Escherichia coli]